MKLLFMGRKSAGAKALSWAIKNGFQVIGVLTDQNHPAGTEILKVSRQYEIPVFALEKINELLLTQALDFDIAVSFVYSKIIRNPLLSFPKHGIINFHPAPLPEYKGTCGYNVAILENLKQWAITAHYMNENIDDGPIIDKLSFTIDQTKETAVSLEKKSMQAMLSLYKKVMKRVLETGILPTQNNIGGTYISRSQMEAMKRINPDDDIERKVRAFWFPPYRGAYIEIEGVAYTLVPDQLLQNMKK